MLEPSKSKIYLVGSGLSALSAAALLIRDAGVPGRSISVLEQMAIAGGSLDGTPAPTPECGYVSRGVGRFAAHRDGCLWDLLAGIPSRHEPERSVGEEIRAFNREHPARAGARVLCRDGATPDHSRLAVDQRDRVDLVRLLGQPEPAIGARRIDEFFRPAFFESGFWCGWRAMSGFQPWHSAVELKRHFDWYDVEFDAPHGAAEIWSCRYDVCDSIVLPLQHWLREQGVAFEFGVTVEDIDFAADATGRYATKMYLTRSDGSPRSIVVEPEDGVFVTVGSMTADCGYGDGRTPARLVRGQRDGSWRLWEMLGRKASDFGRPTVFGGDIAATAAQSFTVTVGDRALLDRIEEHAGGLTALPDSAWLFSVDVPAQPHFRRQRPGTYTICGRGLRGSATGDFVNKPMGDCTGLEILDELLGHLGCADIAARVRESAAVTTVRMPYAGAAFQPRTAGDRPLVVPDQARNFAFLGQFVELPDGIAATAEYAVRSAMTAVYHHFPLDRELPAALGQPAGRARSWFTRQTVPNP